MHSFDLIFRFPSVFHQQNYITNNVKPNFEQDADSGLASVDTLLSASPSFSSNPRIGFPHENYSKTNKKFSLIFQRTSLSSLSYHTLPLDEPLEPPLTPPQHNNKKKKQMIPCVEESFHFFYTSKFIRLETVRLRIGNRIISCVHNIES